ncbi:MAG: hypothetical protein R3326_06810 [Gemmatimonadota bacterium]|nr:hypothetical protein [Gemmatimonadota bacterium]
MRIRTEKVIGIALLVAGLVATAIGLFGWTTREHEAQLPGVEIEVRERERPDYLVWIGAVAVVGGAVLLLTPLRRE